MPMRAGETLALWYPSANRDEDVFAEPDVFDIGREPNEHLAFGGYGEHFCLGATLARLELRGVFGHLLERLEEIRVNGEVERLGSGLIGGSSGCRSVMGFVGGRGWGLVVALWLRARDAGERAVQLRAQVDRGPRVTWSGSRTLFALLVSAVNDSLIRVTRR